MVALLIRHANYIFVRRSVASSVPRLDLPYFTTLSHKRHDFKGKKYLT